MAYARRDIRGGAVQTTISSGISAGATSCAIVASTGWPDGSVNGSFYVVIDPGLTTEEKILCSTRSSLTVNFTTRGADGSTASAHASGAVIYPVMVAVDADEANYAVSKTVGKVTTAGDLLVGDAVNSMVRLGKGSNSTALTVDSGGTLGYSTITNAMLAGSIAYSKLSLTGAILNADLAGSIAYSKLSLAGSILNADVSNSAAIAYSKLNLASSITSADIVNGTIVNADISASAAIATSKLALTAGTGITISTDTISVDTAIVTTGGWTSYTPTVTQSGAVTKTVTYAKSAISGKQVTVNVYLAITGSGTTNNTLTVSIPLTAANSQINTAVGSGIISHAGSTYPVIVLFASTTTVKFLRAATEAASGYWGVDPNLAMQNGDAITFTMQYEST